MMENADLWEAAGYLGMTVETLQRVYGHFRPEHNSGVRKIIERRRAPDLSPMSRAAHSDLIFWTLRGWAVSSAQLRRLLDGLGDDAIDPIKHLPTLSASVAQFPGID
jgi:hypothetical protein